MDFLFLKKVSFGCSEMTMKAGKRGGHDPLFCLFSLPGISPKKERKNVKPTVVTMSAVRSVQTVYPNVVGRGSALTTRLRLD